MRILCVLTIALGLVSTVAAGENDDWKKPLSEKERILDANILVRHNILGLYPSMVEVPPGGGPIDISTTTPFSDIVHAVCWTANHLAGASYRYRFLKDSGAADDVVEKARARADQLFEAVYRCQRLTGVKGMQARGYFLGHGPVYAERHGNSRFDDWHQGHVDGQDVRWRGDPSHHNYSDSIHGLGQYYDLAAVGTQKERARQAIDSLVSYWVDNDLLIHKLDRTRRPVNILGMTDGKTLNTRVMMAIAGAKVAHHATGKEKFKKTYDQIIEQFGVRGLKKFRVGKDFDDAEHVFSHLETLFRIEKDPELLAAYAVVADALWANHKNDGQSLFTYIYFGIRPDAPGREKALEQAHRSLTTWPTDMTIQPRMNSLFPERKPPYPVYQARYDNEYIWKGDLLHPDGWLSRIVTDVDVSAEDPMLIAAIDTSGDLYLSRDGAATAAGWHPINQTLRSPVRSVRFGSSSRILAVACADGFYLSTSGGASWSKLPVPAGGARPVDIVFDQAGPFGLYAITSKGIFRSRDFGRKFLGQSWIALADDLPKNASFSFTVAPGKPTRLYAKTGDRFFTRAIDDSQWTLGGQIGLGQYSRSINVFAIDPGNPNRAFAGAGTLGRGPIPLKTIIQETTDGGAAWTNDMPTIFKMFADRTLMDLLKVMPSGYMTDLTIDPHAPQTLYAVAKDLGVLKSTDGGKSWSARKKGLDIPLAKTVFAPRHSNWIFAGTPAGLFVSKDKGETWENANLVLQFTKNHRRELGGASFIDAYWRARHYGFIDEEFANRRQK